MYATHPLMVIDQCAKYGSPMLKQKNNYWSHTNACKKKVQDQRRIGVINVRNISSHGDRPMCRTRRHVKNFRWKQKTLINKRAFKNTDKNSKTTNLDLLGGKAVHRLLWEERQIVLQ